MSNLPYVRVHNTIKCPDCGSLAKRELYSVVPLVHRPLSYDDNGFLIADDSLKGYTMYRCRNCGKEYKNVE